jgi:hypothetical protein
MPPLATSGESAAGRDILVTLSGRPQRAVTLSMPAIAATLVTVAPAHASPTRDARKALKQSKTALKLAQRALTKPAGSFKIDDPVDPANRYLQRRQPRAHRCRSCATKQTARIGAPHL